MIKRKLTDEEITDILSVIKPSKILVPLIAQKIYKEDIEGFRKQLSKILTYPIHIPKIKAFL